MEILLIEDTRLLDLAIGKFKESARVKDNMFFIGLDCEFICKKNQPESFIKSQNWTKKSTYDIAVCTMQLSSKSMSLFIDLKRLGGINNILKNILESENWIKCGVGINNDIRYLSDNFELSICYSVYDLNIHHKLTTDDTKSSLDYLSKKYDVGKKLGSNSHLYDWGKDMYDQRMIKYAVNDSILSERLGRRIILNEDVVLQEMEFDDSQIKITNSQMNVASNVISDNIQIGKLNDCNIQMKELANPITFLKEYADKKTIREPLYEISFGNDGLFACSCKFGNKESVGKAKNKKEAKTESAKNFIEKYFS